MTDTDWIKEGVECVRKYWNDSGEYVPERLRVLRKTGFASACRMAGSRKEAENKPFPAVTEYDERVEVELVETGEIKEVKAGKPALIEVITSFETARVSTRIPAGYQPGR